jgi:hypothetical protein
MATMFQLTMEWDLQGLPRELTFTARLYILSLLVGTAYTIYSLVRAAIALHRVDAGAAANTPNARHALAQLAARLENLRQLHGLLFLLFGMSFANETFHTFLAIRLMTLSLAGPRFEIFGPPVAFALVVFIVLAVLHSAQWLVAARLQSTLASITSEFSS